MATSEATIRKIHADIVSSKLPANVSAKWTIFSAARGLKVEEDYDGNMVREGDIDAFVKDYSSPDYEGSILFALVKLAIPNTQPVAEKCALVEWCDTNAPPLLRNNFFPGQSNALKKLLPGYNVPMEIRTREDLTAEDVLQKVGGAAPQAGARGAGGPPPPVASKPVVSRPTRVAGGGSGFNPLGSGVRAASQRGDVDKDGWGADAPPVTRSQLEKVESAYKPTKVDLGTMRRSEQEPSRYITPQRDDTPSDVVRGGYQPIGKVDIAEIRRKAKEGGGAQDDRPTIVKGAYEPVGKVDIAAIRAKAQGPGAASTPSRVSPAATGGSAQDEEAPKSLAERSAAFSQSERLASLPKPKVANKFGSGGSTFAGTKAPTPAALGPKPTTAAPVGIASRTFADEGGKTPAQIWAEKKARQGGAPQPVQAQPSGLSSQASGDGGWKSGYSGKSWAPVQTTHTGTGSNISAQKTGQEEQEDEPVPAGGVGAIRDRFKDAAPIGMGAPPPPRGVSAPSPPQMDMSSKPHAGGPRGVPIPGLPTRPAAAEEDDYPDEQTQHIPPPPAQPRSPSPPTPDEMRSSSPVRIAMPVGRGAAPEPAEEPEQSLPAASLSKVVSERQETDDEPQAEDDEAARGAAQTMGGSSAPAATGGQRAQIQYDYEPAEDNEIELREGDFVTNIDMVDDDWWMGVNSKGEQGLFPSNYVELVEDEQPAAPAPAPAPAARDVPPPPPPAAAPAASQGATATAQYDYEAAEDNELSFPDGATITGVEFPDDDWWFGHYGGKEGLFPANYVQLDQ
ncbi:hypothetical protein EJ05DRAFT_479662 [Pseudovirgaria hyperparasitica]|uniref:Uncharacterized protein n=1 Tax=Pseudovirgaria hyperparasitica TaxID=470096 RepID=A0A6A6VV60_9PEZI|nr:uncharacterized protein EJ05DRAFT_479662 [Pseudovirgaria hyperparasitica]KAF2754113.1 hypothetical protein EJ05DRAFT_479662 [Pseudovirgaria hyperparasitica]